MSAINVEQFESEMEAAIAAQPESNPPKFATGDNGDPDFDEHGNRIEAKKLDPLSILTFDQIDAIPIDENDRIFGDHLLDKGGSLVVAGQGGTGKSRLIFQFLAACKADHAKFLTFDIHPGARDVKWLVLQTENSIRRLKFERKNLRNWIGTGPAWEKYNAEVLVLAPVKEQDTMLNLDDPDNVERIRMALEAIQPTGVIADPLGDYAVDDLNKDVHMRETIMALSRLVRKGNPKRPLVLLHHALTGAAGVAKAVGFDRASFARNSKVLFNWTRAQINISPMKEDNNETLVVSCGKCSDGKEFPAFAITLNPETLIYEIDPDFDVVAWSQSMTGKKVGPDIDSAGVQALCQPAMRKAELARIIMQEIGCGRQSAYRHIIKALRDKTVKEVDGQMFKL